MLAPLQIMYPLVRSFLPTPKDEAPQPSESLEDDQPREATKARRILIADDHHGERTVIRRAVEHFTDFRVCGEATNGTEAIQRAKELRPDLIIMDLAMPLMNGIEAASVLKNELPSVPIVLFTLYDELVRPKLPMFGVTVVLSKENGLVPLLDCLKKLLGPS